MVTFVPVTVDQFAVFKEIINSNRAFNLLSEGHEELTDAELMEMVTSSKDQGAIMQFVMDGTRAVGVIDYLMENPADKTPWLGLLIIHSDYQGCGYASAALEEYERLMRGHGVKKVRLGVIQGNERALRFWRKKGFTFYGEKHGDKWAVSCFEKKLW